MINQADRHLIGKARLLRRQGKTYDEIRAEIGDVSDEDLRAWLKGIPRPPGTYRAKAKDDVRAKSRQLRARGLTYDDIAAITGASVGSLSLWLHDMPREFPGSKEQRLARLQATCARKREQRAASRAEETASAAQDVGPVTDRELFLVGLGIYWAEGSKSKPWRTYERLVFINSDPSMIIVLMRWLTLLGVGRDGCHFRVSIHETADVPAAERYWADLLGVDATTFNRSSIKRHSPKTVRYNTGVDYHGCLIVDVLQSAAIYRKVEGWWQGLTVGAARTESNASKSGPDLDPFEPLG